MKTDSNLIEGVFLNDENLYNASVQTVYTRGVFDPAAGTNIGPAEPSIPTAPWWKVYYS